MWSEYEILEVLDECCRRFTFPMLDNGYVYLAATRLSAYRAQHDWALVIEVFGFSPRASLPDLHVSTFASTLRGRKLPSSYVTTEAHENYLRTNPHNESATFFPIQEGDWQDDDDGELVATSATELVLRDKKLKVPRAAEFAASGVQLEDEGEIQVFELMRLLAAGHRDDVLATAAERRVNVPEHLDEILVLEDWGHPDLAADEVASDSPTFRQLAKILSADEAVAYEARGPGNTHWSNWPEGGTL